MSVITALKSFGVVLLTIGVISEIARAVRLNSGGGGAASQDSAEATIGSSAIRLIGQPSLVFGICCLVMAFAAEQLSKPIQMQDEGPFEPAVETYAEGGEGALLVTVPYLQAVQLFNGAVALSYESGFRSGPKVSGGMLSHVAKGPFDSDKVRCGPGGQCYLRYNGSKYARINVLAWESMKGAVLSVHPITVNDQ